MFCPNYKIKEVKDGFNEIVTALGGQPLTDEEFKSGELRNQRTGLNYQAMEAAYKLYHRNGGNMLDIAPNGKHSVLWDTLLNYFNGDRVQAIRAKSNVYSDEFFNWFGDWGRFKTNIANKTNPYSSNITLGDVTMDFDSADIHGAGAMIPIKKGDKIIGGIALNAYYRARDRFEPWGKDKDRYVSMSSVGDAVEIDEDQRGKGYGKAAYFEMAKLAARNGLILISAPDDSRTDAATRVWESLTRDGYTKRVGNRYEFINSSLYTGVSKVVDENGEPLVVWHGSKASNLQKFDLNEATDKQSIFASQSKNVARSYVDWNDVGYFYPIYNSELDATHISYESYKKHIEDLNNLDGVELPFPVDTMSEEQFNARQHAISEFNRRVYPIFVSIKNPFIVDAKGQNWNRLVDGGKIVNTGYIARRSKQSGHDGAIVLNIRDNGLKNQYDKISGYEKANEYIMFNPNQIKHVENLGTWNPNDANIYHQQAKIDFSTQQQLSSPSQFFGTSIYETLNSGNQVSSRDILQNILNRNLLSSKDKEIAEILARHDIPVLFEEQPLGQPMSIKAFKDGGFVIVIDPRQLSYLSNEFAATSLLHEVVHALTVGAIKEPKTAEDRAFAEANQKLYSLFNAVFPESEYSREDAINGMYILKDKYEFAAVFMTDPNAKFTLYQKAVELDKAGNNRVLLRLKRFVNALTRLVVNKNVFKNIKQDELKLYEKIAKKYIIGKPTILRGNISNADIYSSIYNSLNTWDLNTLQAFNSYQSGLRTFTDFVTYAIRTEGESKLSFEDGMALRLHIADLLLIRDAAIASSQLPESDKIHYRDAISGQVAQLHNKNLKTVSVLSKFLQETVPLLMEDYKSVANVDTTDNTFYMYQAHDNFGAYKSIFDYIARALQSPSIKEELSEELKDATAIDKLSVVKDINTMANLVAKGSGLALDGINVMFYILMRNMRRDLGKIAEDTHLPTAQLFLNELESIGFDTSKFFEYVGAKDGTKDTTVRSLVYLVNKAIREADEVTYNKAVDLLKLEEKLSIGQSVLDLYEVDSEGKTTGYLVRKRNYGKFYNAYREAIEKINEDFGLPKENRSAPEDYELRKKWNKAKNDWLAKNCDRRYLPEYYEAYNELSELTLNAQESIRSEIHLIKSQPGILGEDGYYHYEKLSSKDWKRLQGLYIERRLLSSDYDINGNKKIEDSDAWKVAKELLALREKLFGDKNKMVKDIEAWQKARQKVIDDAKASGEDVDEVLKKWDARNSTRRLKYDEASEQALVYKQIDEELYELTKGSVEKPVYEVNGDGGAQYEANELRIRDMLNVFKDYNTGEVNLAFLPLSVKHKVRLLEVENSKIRKKALAENKELRKQERKYKKARKKLLKKYLVFKVTDQYKATSNDFDDDGTINIDDVQERAPRWATKIIVRDAFDDNGESLLDKYTELIPGDGWVNTDENSSMINKDFDESEGTSMVPKLELYDNSEQYNKITGALKDLYDEVFKTMLESNALLYNRKYHDDYMLPQVTGSIFKYMKKQGQPWLAAWAKVKEEAGVSKQGIRMDTTMGLNIDQIFDDVNELEELITNSDETFGGKSTGRRPDDRLFNIIPQYFTRKLDDPSQLSSDLIGILCEYYNLCNGFKHKSQIKDTCEAMMDMLENRTVTRRTKLGNYEQIRGKQSTTYKIARSFLDMNLYGIKSQSNEKFGVNLDKLGLNFRNYTTANNLGMNPAVAATGFLTASYAHIINGLTGNKGYGMREVFSAGAEVLSHFVKNMGGLNYLGNKTTNDKLMALMEYFNVTDQLDRKFKHSNRNRLARVIFGNWCFGMLTGLDFIIKSNITVSNLMAHRLFEGEFLSKEDIYNRYYNASKEELAEKIKKWNEGVCLYSIFDIKNGKLTIDEKYAEAFARNKFMISERILKSAENADGMATETQKAQITTSFLGAAVLTHRQYFPLLLQDRFGETVYDLDTLLYNQGQFRTIAAIAKFIALGSKDSQKSGFFSNRIDAIKTYLNDNSSKEAAGISRARRKHLKKTVLELLAFNLFVSPFISMLANYADDDDNKDDLLLLLITYISRRTEWEIFTPYRVGDALNNFKTVSAQTGTLDNIQALYNATFRQIFPQESLYNTLLGLENKKIGNGSFGGGGATSRWGESTNTIKRGIYQEKTKQFKAMMKLNPFHNTWEQWYGSKLKRKYYENQIMELNK